MGLVHAMRSNGPLPQVKETSPMIWQSFQTQNLELVYQRRLVAIETAFAVHIAQCGCPMDQQV